MKGVPTVKMIDSIACSLPGPGSSYVTGIALLIDGGYTAR
jgi:hypothetical protein